MADADVNGAGLKAFLSDKDIACPACGYNLRGLHGASCPECAQPLVLRVALAEPDIGKFIAALVGLSLGAGFSGLLGIYFLMTAISGHMSGKEWRQFLFVLILPFTVDVLTLCVLVRLRGRFQRAASNIQGLVIAGAWALTMAGFVAFRMMMR